MGPVWRHLGTSLDQSQDRPRTGPNWSRDRPLRISSLRYTGFKACLVASDILSLDGPRIGYARLVIAGNSSNHSTILDSLSVITLGQHANVPLMCL